MSYIAYITIDSPINLLRSGIASEGVILEDGNEKRVINIKRAEDCNSYINPCNIPCSAKYVVLIYLGQDVERYIPYRTSLEAEDCALDIITDYQLSELQQEEVKFSNGYSKEEAKEYLWSRLTY